MTSFASVLGIGSVRTGPTYEGLYGGEYAHPNPDKPGRRPLAAQRAMGLRRRRRAGG
jgi:hypothetical protein